VNKAYISSTFDDLRTERERVSTKLRSLQIQVVGMEDYTAEDAQPLDACLRDVAECDIYVGIFAWRYGYIPKDGNPEMRSITELEYRRASELGKDCLIFLLAENAPWPPTFSDAFSNVSDRGNRVQALRDELGKEHMVSRFRNPDDLAASVTAAVAKVQERRMRADLEEQRREIADESASRHKGLRKRIAGHQILAVADYFRGRVDTACELGRLLAEPSTRVVSIVGRPGIGKTALASKVLSELEHNRWPHTQDHIPVDGIVYLSTRTSNITLEQILFECSLLLGGERGDALSQVAANPKLSAAERADRLFEALREGLYVILLDHVDDLLDSERRICDSDLRTLFERSLVANHSTRLLITSRDPLSFRPDMMRFDKQIALTQGLSTADGVAMLRDMDPNGRLGIRELSDGELGRAVERLHGVPRALELLAGLFQGEWSRSLDDILEEFYHQDNVIESLIRAAYQRLDLHERQIMEILAVLARPVPQVAVSFMMAQVAPGLNVDNVLRRLNLMYMVTADRTTKTLSLNPIDNDYAYSQIPEQGDYSRRVLERCAAEYYAALRVPRKAWKTALDFEPQFLEFDHRVRAQDNDIAAGLLTEIDVRFVAWRGQVSRLRGMYRALDQKVRDERLQLLYAYGLGVIDIFLGRMHEAFELLENAYMAACKRDDKEMQGMSLAWMGEINRRSGRLHEAVEQLSLAAAMCEEQAVPLVDDVMLDLSLALSYAGRVGEAAQWAKHLMDLSIEANDSQYEASAHNAFALAELVAGRPGESIRHAQHAIRLYDSHGIRGPQGYVYNVQGLAHLAQQQLEEAIKCFDNGRMLCSSDNDPRLDGFCSFNLARAYRIKNDLEKACEMAQTAKLVLARAGAPEVEAASSLWDALRASQLKDAKALARALVLCARESYSTPDLHFPLDLVDEAESVARIHGMNDVVEETVTLRRTIMTRPDQEISTVPPT
jgi:tetratricopeptide (TPR) repeat protein